MTKPYFVMPPHCFLPYTTVPSTSMQTRLRKRSHVVEYHAGYEKHLFGALRNGEPRRIDIDHVIGNPLFSERMLERDTGLGTGLSLAFLNFLSSYFLDGTLRGSGRWCRFPSQIAPVAPFPSIPAHRF
jgi:hypothetical protein